MSIPYAIRRLRLIVFASALIQCRGRSSTSTDAAPPPPDAGEDAGGSGSIDASAYDAAGRETFKSTLTRADVANVTTEDAARMVRVVPSVDNGKPVGIRLFGIRADSLAGKAGFLNGDMVTAIQGHEVMGDAERVLDLFTKLKTTKVTTVDLVRRGAPCTLMIYVTG